ncbi:flavodoxin family protein [Kineosporia sp. J2-2]|uniref:Flavodoxin family protein n=1 Tax=Kineosporia corallincola TaxID=2835133 RepID=A0ABS5TF69_9ACTN|nr:flavodoxin domain-containing protein [Kineosporia corallincola]MBT0768733.1 flavodoxin family protein [Kineosporia corallincola]
MNVLIVTESCFGNTRRFADAVVGGLTSRGAVVTVTAASDATPEMMNGVDLLLVGAPTHNRGLPGPASRRTAAAQGARPDVTGVAEWLDGMDEWRGRAAAFCSVSGTGFINGSAARKIVKKLQRYTIDVVGTENFLVGAAEGPPADGELERAEKWGASLVG